MIRQPIHKPRTKFKVLRVEFDPHMNESKHVCSQLGWSKLLRLLSAAISPVLCFHLFMSTSIHYHNVLPCNHHQHHPRRRSIWYYPMASSWSFQDLLFSWPARQAWLTTRSCFRGRHLQHIPYRLVSIEPTSNIPISAKLNTLLSSLCRCFCCLHVPRVHIGLDTSMIVYWSSCNLKIAASTCCMSCRCCLFVA